MDQSAARASEREEPNGRISLEEALRTIASDLEAAGASAAQLTFGHQTIKLETPGLTKARDYRWSELAVRSRTQVTRRRAEASSPYPDLLALTRWSVLLRLTGQL